MAQQSSSARQEIVVPGELLDETGSLKPGANTYREGERIYALRLGLKRVSHGQVDVVALSGRYDPQRGDMIIATVVEVGPSNWYLDINAHDQVGMHVNEVPWRVDFGETTKYLNIGDTVLLKVYHVDDVRKAQLTMKDRACRKLSGGVTIRVEPAKVPRMIGRGGSMIANLKARTNCRVIVGRNGVVWLDGRAEDVSRAVAAIRLIEEQAHTSGLTDRVAAFLGGGPLEGVDEAAGEEDYGHATGEEGGAREGPASEFSGEREEPGEREEARPRFAREEREDRAPRAFGREERGRPFDREERGGREERPARFEREDRGEREERPPRFERGAREEPSPRRFGREEDAGRPQPPEGREERPPRDERGFPGEREAPRERFGRGERGTRGSFFEREERREGPPPGEREAFGRREVRDEPRGEFRERPRREFREERERAAFREEPATRAPPDDRPRGTFREERPRGEFREAREESGFGREAREPRREPDEGETQGEERGERRPGRRRRRRGGRGRR